VAACKLEARVAEERVTRTPAEMRALIVERLVAFEPSAEPRRIAGMTDAHVEAARHLLPQSPTAAAVLIPIVEREDALYLLFTQRAAHLRHHAGQISFPGGRVESGDLSHVEAALRETEEEIGLDRSFITVAGYLDAHLAMSGYSIVPIVGFVRPGFTLKLNAQEVTEVFEVPLEHMLNPVNHKTREMLAEGINYSVYDIPYGERNIWGATAGMVMSLYRLIFGEVKQPS
jgi:8-oxo-dGTP pyrophosphatase MutT (NUDIX family)